MLNALLIEKDVLQMVVDVLIALFIIVLIIKGTEQHVKSLQDSMVHVPMLPVLEQLQVVLSDSAEITIMKLVRRLVIRGILLWPMELKNVFGMDPQDA